MEFWNQWTTRSCFRLRFPHSNHTVLVVDPVLVVQISSCFPFEKQAEKNGHDPSTLCLDSLHHIALHIHTQLMCVNSKPEGVIISFCAWPLPKSALMQDAQTVLRQHRKVLFLYHPLEHTQKFARADAATKWQNFHQTFHAYRGKFNIHWHYKVSSFHY